MSCKTFRVQVFYNPTETNASKSRVEDIVCKGQCLEEIRCYFYRHSDVRIALNEKEVPQQEWLSTKVQEGDKVVIVPSIGFFAAIGAGLSYLGSSAVMGSIMLNLALGFAFSYLGGLIFGQNLKQSEESESQTYSWNPQTTSQEGIAIPRCVGRTMHTGNIVAKWTDTIHGVKTDYTLSGLEALWNHLFGKMIGTERVGGMSTELLYMIVDLGMGPIEGMIANGLYLNDQPISTYPSVTVQERVGTLDQTCMTGFEKLKNEYRVSRLVTNEGGAYTFVTPNDYFDDLEFTIEFNRGLWWYGDSGKRRAHAVGVKVEISVYGADSWTTLLDQSISSDSLAAVFRSYTASDLGFTCVYGTQYELRFTKTTTDKTQPNRYGDDLTIRGIREVVDTAFTYPGHVLIGITATASNLLNGSIQIKCITDNRIVATYNGSAWVFAHSRNRAYNVLDYVLQPVLSGSGTGGDPWVVERYDGTDPSLVDLAWFYEWAAFCDVLCSDGDGGTEARDYCDYNLDAFTNVWSLITGLAQVGRAKLYWQGNVLTGWIDDAVADDTDLVTFDEIMLKTWQNSWMQSTELAGTLEVFYNDELQGYERKSMLWSKADAGQYKKDVSVEGMGIVRVSQAVRLADFTLDRNKKIRNVNSFDMHKAAMRYALGDKIRLQATVPNWGNPYKIKAVESSLQTLTMDRAIAEAVGDILFVRTYDENSGIENAIVTPYTIETVSEKDVTLTSVLNPVPAAENQCAAGASGDIKERRIIQIVQKQDNYYNITVETYDATLYTGDGDITHPAYNKDYVWPSPASHVIQPSNWNNVSALLDELIPLAPNTEVPTMSNIEWTGDSSAGSISWAARNTDNPIVFRFRGEDYDIAEDVTTDEFIYWDPTDPEVLKGTADVMVAIASGRWLMCVNKDGVVYPANAMQLLHAGIIMVGTLSADLIAARTIIGEKIILGGVDTTELADEATHAGGEASNASDVDLTDAYADIITMNVASTGIATEVTAYLAVHNYGIIPHDFDYIVYNSTDANTIITDTSVTFAADETKLFNLSICIDVPSSGTVLYKVRAKASVSSAMHVHAGSVLLVKQWKGK